MSDHNHEHVTRRNIAHGDGGSGVRSTWVLQCDGTATPNPGQLGIGVVVVDDVGGRVEISRELLRRGDNNEAEIEAVIAALVAARDGGARMVEVRSDSDVVVRELKGLTTTAVPKLATLFATAKQLIAGFDDVKIVLVTRLHNREADALARAALGLAAKLPRHLRPRKRRS